MPKPFHFAITQQQAALPATWEFIFCTVIASILKKSK